MPLSPYEQRQLAAIAEDLGDPDPRLARALARAAPRTFQLRGLPFSLWHLAALGAGLCALILVHALAGELHPAVSAALTCGLVGVWLPGHRPDGPSSIHQSSRQHRAAAAATAPPGRELMASNPTGFPPTPTGMRSSCSATANSRDPRLSTPGRPRARSPPARRTPDPDPGPRSRPKRTATACTRRGRR